MIRAGPTTRQPPGLNDLSPLYTPITAPAHSTGRCKSPQPPSRQMARTATWLPARLWPDRPSAAAKHRAIRLPALGACEPTPACAARRTLVQPGSPRPSHRSAKRLAAVFAGGLFGLTALVQPSAATAAEAPLPRVASMDLCSDLLLLQVGAPEQIVSVSSASQDPKSSPMADRARAYPANRSSVEDLLYLQPDIALVYLGWGGRRHSQLLAGRGTELLPVPYPRGWADALQTTRDIAAGIGRAERGQALAEQARRRMQALAETPRPFRVLYLRPNGGTAGADTYVDDVLTLLGLRNVAKEEGFSGWGRFPLEHLVAAPPDLFLLGYFDEAQPLSKSSYARHALLRRMLEETPSISVPTAYWGCGGIELVEAAERIAAQIDALPAPADSARARAVP